MPSVKDTEQMLANSISIPKDLTLINIAVDRDDKQLDLSERRKRIRSSNTMHRRKLHTANGAAHGLSKFGTYVTHK